MHSCCWWFSASLLITNRLSPFWKHVVPTKHCSMMYSTFTINFLNHFKRFCGIKTGFPAKMNRCRLFNCFFFHYNLWHGQNRQVTSHCEYVPHCEWFELKFGMRGEKGLLTNFLRFHGDRADSTMFSPRCRKTYQTDLVRFNISFLISETLLNNNRWSFLFFLSVFSQNLNKNVSKTHSRFFKIWFTFRWNLLRIIFF